MFFYLLASIKLIHMRSHITIHNQLATKLQVLVYIQVHNFTFFVKSCSIILRCRIALRQPLEAARRDAGIIRGGSDHNESVLKMAEGVDSSGKS